MSRILAVLLVALVVSVLVPGVGGTVLAEPAAPRAAAAPQHAAAVVIDTGQEVRRVCVRFSEERITGEELLRRADVDAVFARSSLGAGVCALCGTGCPADDCFCESTTTGRYWNYSFADGTAWRRASRGASSRTVGHGDVDGWAWGPEGATPPLVPFEAVCDVALAEPEPEPPPEASPSPSPTPAPPAEQTQQAPQREAASSPAPQPGASPPAAPGPTATGASPAPAPPPPADAQPADPEPADPEPTSLDEPDPHATAIPAMPPPTPILTPQETATPEAAVLEVADTPSGGLGGQLALFGVLASVLGGAIAWRRRATWPVEDH